MKKKRTRGVFSELSAQNAANDSIKSFIDFTTGLYYSDRTTSQKIYELHAEYLQILSDKQFHATINRLADIEHRILQYHCYKAPELTYGLFTHERGGEKLEYIILRAPFPMRKQNRQEIRVYLGKLSDYKGKTLDELQNDKKFIKTAVLKMKESMQEQMDNL